MNHARNNVSLIAGMFLIACSCFLAGCFGFGEEAPLSDGLYLHYDFGGSGIRVTFYEIDADSFHAVLSSGSDTDIDPDEIPDERKTTVDRRLKKERGTPYEAGILGPIWIPPSRAKKGGRVYGDEVVAVRQWEGWDVGVVKANFGRGALRGEWYYDTRSGFLVGGKRATVMNADEGGTVFVLEDSNLEILFD
jgi:hypothetical protein